MAKKVFLNGVEIYTSAEMIASEKLFGFVQEVLEALESALAGQDEILRLNLRFEFHPHHNPKHHIHLSIKNGGVRKKVAAVLHCSALDFTDHISKEVQFDMMVQVE